jgi:hypothetical protein
MFLGIAFLGYSQEKVEKEYRIDVSNVPENAREFVDTFAPESTITWLQEESEKGASIEAKFKLNGKRHSIEFSNTGELQDLEIVMPFSKINKKARLLIEQHLQQTFDYFKIEKTQAQYIGLESEILDWHQGSIRILPQYEIVVKTRAKGQKAQRLEFLFNNQGELLNTSKVVLRRDNILRF